MFASLLVLHVPGLYGEDSNGGGCSALHVREALSLQSLCGPITKVAVNKCFVIMPRHEHNSVQVLKLSVPENNSVTQVNEFVVIFQIIAAMLNLSVSEKGTIYDSGPFHQQIHAFCLR